MVRTDMVATQAMRAFAGIPLRQTVCPHTHIAQRTTAHTGATLAADTGIYAKAAVAYQQLVKERSQHITFQPGPSATQHFTLVKRCPAGHTRRHMCHALAEGSVFTLLHVRTVHIEPRQTYIGIAHLYHINGIELPPHTPQRLAQ